MQSAVTKFADSKDWSTLRCIEYTILTIYKDNPGMLDFAVVNVLEAVAEHYCAERLNRQERKICLEGPEIALYEGLCFMCDWRLGHAKGEDVAVNEKPCSYDQVLHSLKTTLQFVRKFTKAGGRQGFLKFIADREEKEGERAGEREGEK